MDWRGVVDVGSLSAKLVLTDGQRRVRRSADVALGGVSMSSTGRLTPTTIEPAALERLATALTGYRQLAADRGATLRAVGTAAARHAVNGAAMAAVVADALGVELEILDGESEARLAFLGACSDPALAAGPVATIDLGGASTELTVGTADGPVAAHSLPIGGSLLARTYVESDPPRPEELSAALSVVALHVEDLHRELAELRPALDDGATVLALGGVVTIAAVEVGLVDDDPLNGEGDGPLHAFELTREAVEDVFRTVATESRADRAHNPGLPSSRVDDIVGGCGLLVEVMRRLDVETVLVSQRGLADGVLASWS